MIFRYRGTTLEDFARPEAGRAFSGPGMEPEAPTPYFVTSPFELALIETRQPPELAELTAGRVYKFDWRK